MDDPAKISDLLPDVFAYFPKSEREAAREAFLGSSVPGAGLVLSDDGTFLPALMHDEGTGVLGYVAPERIAELFQQRYGTTATGAELHLLTGLIAGLDLKQISARDRVSYQTRRNQLKALMGKAETARQADLVATMATLIALDLMRDSDADRQGQSLLRAHLERFYDGRARLYSHHVADADDLLVLDVGPLSGRPVICAHGGLITFQPFPYQLDQAERLNLRWITVFRPGFFGIEVDLDAPPQARIEAHAARAAAFLTAFGFAGSPIFSHALGADYAVALARHLGPALPRLILHAPILADPVTLPRLPATSRTFRRFVARAPRLAVRTMRHLGKISREPRRLEETIARMAISDPAVAGYLDMPERREWHQHVMSEIAPENAPGFIADLQNSGDAWIEPLAELTAPVRILVGAQDSHLHEDQLRARLAGSGVAIERYPGHNMYSLLFDLPSLEAALFGP